MKKNAVLSLMTLIFIGSLVTAKASVIIIGSVTVTINPDDAVSAGAQWQFDGGEWRNSGESAGPLNVGTSHTVSFKEVSGYNTPPSQTVIATASVTGTYSAVSTSASHLSLNQQCNFSFVSSAYFAFIYDYSGGVQESTTPGIISYDTHLNWNAQSPLSMTTHVSYVYNASLGRYTEAFAIVHQYL